MKVGFIGTRLGMTFPQRERIVWWLRNSARNMAEFHHGDGNGADLQIHWIVSTYHPSSRIIVHPGTVFGGVRPRQFDEGYLVSVEPPKPPSFQDRDIAHACEVMLVAFSSKDEQNYARMRKMVWYASALRKPCTVFDELGDDLADTYWTTAGKK